MRLKGKKKKTKNKKKRIVSDERESTETTLSRLLKAACLPGPTTSSHPTPHHTTPHHNIYQREDKRESLSLSSPLLFADICLAAQLVAHAVPCAIVIVVVALRPFPLTPPVVVVVVAAVAVEWNNNIFSLLLLLLLHIKQTLCLFHKQFRSLSLSLSQR